MSETDIKTFDDLLDFMRLQAKNFLDEMGEFFPYGSVLTKNKTLKTVGLYNNKGDLNVKKAIEILSESILKDIESGEILIGAIGIDVIISESKENGVLIKVMDYRKEWFEQTFAYEIVEEKCIWKQESI